MEIGTHVFKTDSEGNQQSTIGSVKKTRRNGAEIFVVWGGNISSWENASDLVVRPLQYLPKTYDPKTRTFV